MRHASSLEKIILIVGGTLVALGGAQAQETTQPASPASENASPALQEVIVTAQRRSEDVEKVPISVTVLSADELQAFNIDSTQALQGSVPGLQFTENATAGSIYIRGVGNDNPFPDESAVAVYVDGIYRPASSANMFSLNNIQDVEVLKGPQGTLFGRNATGGVLNITTRDPSSTPSGDVSVGYGNYGTYQANAYFTTGIADGLSANVAGYYMDQSEGWGTDVANGAPAFKNRDEAVMSKWKLDLDTTTITLIGDFNQEGTSNGFAGAVIGLSPYTGLPLFAGYYNTNTSGEPYYDTKQGGIALLIDHDLGWAHLRYAGSYRRFTSDVAGDNDYTPSDELFFAWRQYENDQTDEVQLVSPSQSKIKWIVGGFFLYELTNVDPFGLYGPTFAHQTSNTNYLTEVRTVSPSGYGQVTYPLTDDTNVTGGIRYTSDRKNGSGETISTVPSLVTSSAQASHTWDAPTWRIEVDHNFTPGMMSYVSYNRGFKSGIFNQTPFNTLPIAPETVDAYEVGVKWKMPDQAITFNADAFYEDFRNIQIQDIIPPTSTTPPENLIINAAAATIKGLDFQVQAIPVDNLQLGFDSNYSDGVYTKFLNAPAVTPVITDGYILYPSTPGQTQDDTGKSMDRMPKWGAALSVSYTIPVSDGKIVIAGEDSYTSSFYIQPNQQILEPDVNLINASVAWELASGWKLRLWGRNLTDRLYWINVNAFLPGQLLQPDPPRTYGVTLGYHF
jgi:iron complex outermembrane receptor protein